MSINRAIVTGNLTRDAELRATTGGTPVCSFAIAVNERRKGASGEWVDYPNYIDCICFGKRAESLSRYLLKGTKVGVEGSLHQNRWEKDGNKYSRLEIVVSDIDFMSKAQQGNAQQQPKQNTQEQFVANSPEPIEFSNEDIPF